MHFQFAARFAAKLVIVVLMLIAGAASQASAAAITTTYKGTVSSGVDAVGAFGTPGANLAGANYKLVYTVDPAVGAYSTFNGTISDPALSGDQIFGGVSAVLNINGHDYSIAASPSSYDIAAHKPGLGAIVQYAGSPTGSILASLSMANPGPDFPNSVLAGALLTSCPTCTSSMLFNTSGAYAWLNFGTLTIATAPIPATLPLLVSALGGLGFLGWRRRKPAAA